MATDAIAAATSALARADWSVARTGFEAALAVEETPEALEGLGVAARWLTDAPASLAAHERAFRLYRECGDARGAARVGIALSIANTYLRGDPVVAAGWLGRATSLLEEVEVAPEHAWLAAFRAHSELVGAQHDLTAAEAHAEEAARLARELGLLDVEMMALAQHGLALVTRGSVREGMRRLDEATTAALYGEMADPDAISVACCYLIYACKRVRDYRRAARWCARVVELSEGFGDRITFAACRTHYADLLILRGSWVEADTELTDGVRRLQAMGRDQVSDALVRIAELRRRQGRLEEARALYEEAAGHQLAALGQGWLALDEGDASSATELADRCLRRTAPEERTERAPALELLVRARLGAADVAGARAAAAELGAIANAVRTPPLLAAVGASEGLIAAAEDAHAAARPLLEDAVDLLGEELPFERTHARLALARSLAALGRTARAGREAGAAHAEAERLGASLLARDSNALLRELGVDAARRAREVGLTPRESEVLRMVAQGRSNRDIAEALVLSVRTVERHLENVYGKIGAGGRTARAQAAAYAIKHGLA